MLELTPTAATTAAATYLLRYGEREIMLRGYQRFESFRAVIDSLSNGALRVRRPDRSAGSIGAW